MRFRRGHFIVTEARDRDGWQVRKVGQPLGRANGERPDGSSLQRARQRRKASMTIGTRPLMTSLSACGVQRERSTRAYFDVQLL